MKLDEIYIAACILNEVFENVHADLIF